MRRVINKTIAFSLVLLMSITIMMPWIKVDATENSDYMIKVIAANEYSDGVRFGDGYLMLKNGTFDNITSNTTYIFIDENGNKREIKNTVGFTEIFLNTSGRTYYVDYGALAVGKNNKVAIMDINGNLYGGSKNFYECVVHAGDNLFYTTDATVNQDDKADTTIWTLRRKDGSIVKEFTNLNLIRMRVHSNGYEYINYNNNGENELLCINQDGKITNMGSGYSSYTVYGEYGYVVANKMSSSGNGYLISVFNEDGSKAFEFDNCSYIDIQGLAKFGYGKVSLVDGGKWYETLVDKKGNTIYKLGKYETISYYDDKQAIAIDNNANMYLVDHSDKVIFDVNKFAKGFGESYSAITFSSYYVDSTLTVTLIDESKEDDIGTSFFFDSTGKQISGNIKGKINGFNGTYALLYDNKDESYGVVSKDKSFEKRGYSYLNIQRDPNESDIVAIAKDSSDWSDILIMKNGKDIDKYDQLGGNWPLTGFVNGHILVRDKKTYQYGVIDIHGNEIIPTGEYENIIQYADSECIVGHKDGKPYLFDTEGNILNFEGQYKNIGDYKTIFYKFSSWNNLVEYVNGIGNTNMTLTKDNNDKIGIIKVILKDQDKFDVNGDGKININDIAEIAIKYNSNNKSSNWNKKYDINNDNIIDLYDLILVSSKL